MGLAKIKEIKDRIQILTKEYQDEMKSSFDATLIELMNTYGTKNIVIKTYTPGFNDGDEIHQQTSFIYSFESAEDHGFIDNLLEDNNCTVDLDDENAVEQFKDEIKKTKFPVLTEKDEDNVEEVLNVFTDYIEDNYNDTLIIITPEKIVDDKVVSISKDFQDYDCGY